ncbi:alpha-ketoacid dehydrogenase subunit alpha/beta [Ichthyobacterium seriolicida]|uniref:3-methyl-2-oxobutanoate dehydrogenase (2-methylpropanoyl-transferring) n=1 Tax=Ichthyobacterium seriolicida TaxID=242600 RepID=A0A1J1DYM2_9FLAO|nr:alpha-ketoacid dehydrogenase subunit alpha/beta [Ichthyobacterium seriolicida]BAV95007.1 transketolase [Ichthyobacterium seriolicida]
MSDAFDISFEDFRKEILEDYKLMLESRFTSLLGRREVLSGKAKFGIFGDGKEMAQIAMSKVFKKGDFRSGYYRDQTFMMAIGSLTPQNVFSALYGHTDIAFEPASSGRQMPGHYATHIVDDNGNFKNLIELKNSSSDISCTAAQMPKLLGLALASNVYRDVRELRDEKRFSNRGNEIAFGTIGDASTSEGHFFETINAAAVLQVPMIVSVWDDGYGISVPVKYQTAKSSISKALLGFQRTKTEKGIEIITVKGWDYPALIEAYSRAEKLARQESVPVLIHVEDITQPQGHSTSGSHERYKSDERLKFEKDFDCITKMKEWIINYNFIDEKGDSISLSNPEELDKIEKEAKENVTAQRKKAWDFYIDSIVNHRNDLLDIMGPLSQNLAEGHPVKVIFQEIRANREPNKRDLVSAARNSLIRLAGDNNHYKDKLKSWLDNYMNKIQLEYNSNLYDDSVYKVAYKEVVYDQEDAYVDGRVILRDNFDALLSKHNNLIIFGEDVGKIGDVNQGLEGLQQKYGKSRVFDTGIREATIIGQGIGMALRGLRPIAEIQYLDYLLYALQMMSDDLATTFYRTNGKQKVPLIVRTRGHRLEGIWHSGSPMGTIINSLRGIYVLVPRNMQKAAGFYNLLLQAQSPALVIESLNGYRLKERVPKTFADFTTPIGKVEVIREGTDITLVTYGSMCRIAVQASERLYELGISVEIIDVQSLVPLDLDKDILESLKKTNKLMVADEDVPGGASSYILQNILNQQGGFNFLDYNPVVITAKEHRPAYGTDGDYFSKPSVEDILEGAYSIMNEINPNKYHNI